MKVINAARGPNTVSYFYDAERDVFDTTDPRLGVAMNDSLLLVPLRYLRLMPLYNIWLPYTLLGFES